MKSSQARDDLPENVEGVGAIPAAQVLARRRFSRPRPEALQEIVIGDRQIVRSHVVNLGLQRPGLECHALIVKGFDNAMTDKRGSARDGVFSGGGHEETGREYGAEWVHVRSS
jgi:hypothetical protein